MAEEHTYVLTIEASGEVTPANEHPEADEADADEELTDG